jgi:peroxiredoxin
MLMKSSFLRSAAIAFFLNAWLTGAAQGQYHLGGKSAPDFTLPLLAGGEIQLSELEGKNVVVLAFWATWDMYSRQAVPALVELSDEYKAQGVRVLAVNQGEEEPKIRSYLDSAQIDIEVPVDRQRQVFRLYGVRGVPTMMIVDREGIVRHVHVGSQRLKPSLTSALDLILAETPAPVPPPTLVNPALSGQGFTVSPRRHEAMAMATNICRKHALGSCFHPFA